jgi:hypothetical protein
VRVHVLGKAAVLALFSVPLASCENPFGGDDRLVAREAASGDRQLIGFYEARGWQSA